MDFIDKKRTMAGNDDDTERRRDNYSKQYEKLKKETPLFEKFQALKEKIEEI